MPSLLELSRELKAIAEAGLRYTEGSFDRERYQRLHEIASEVLQSQVEEFLWPVEFGYATPKVDVRAAIFRGDDILLVQERSNQLWTLPGGWADVNLTPSANVIKEVREEAGLATRVERLIACHDRDVQGHPPMPEHVYKLLYLCRDEGGEPAPGHETMDTGFFPLEALPALCPSRTGEKYLRWAKDFRDSPDQPALFD